MNETLLSYDPGFDLFVDAPAPAAERVPLEAAADLLAHAGGPGLHGWLRGLLRHAAQGGLRPDVAAALASLLARAARSLLPTAAVDVHTPAAHASRVFGVELEGLSPEDQEFETARRFVAFALDAARHAADPALAGPGPALADHAFMRAARRRAPGWAPGAGAASPFSARPGPADAALSVPSSPGVPTMHDIDRTQLETETGFPAFEAEGPGWPGEQETYGETPGEAYGETYGETFGETYGETFNETYGEAYGPGAGEMQEMALANELLGVGSEAELDQFLGGLLGSLGSLVKSPLGQAVTGVLKGVVKKALPLAGPIVGGMFGGPLGAQIGSGVASAAGNLLGLEAEFEDGAPPEVAGARRFVRLANETVRQAMAAPPEIDPRRAAQAAAIAAARQFAPALLGDLASAWTPPREHRHRGHWVRHGDRITLYGV